MEAGVVNVTVVAEAVSSHISCDNEVVSVPKRGRIDSVTRSLIVKAEGVEMSKTFNWLLCPKGQCVYSKHPITAAGQEEAGPAHSKHVAGRFTVTTTFI
ncbi:Alpha-2-macroglobulin-P [Liparis tanakae]|uniref:Alpha-2-macroglobulin-P n=1 Tax=Liparis tanakae TaxID=230148 RepID=A0A4Z2E562_9TELE|nr:Alpha-2-macroglobulin-P [Liparis tanakae]